LPDGWMFSKLKITDIANSLLNLAGDRVMPRAEVRVRVQASHRYITDLSHIKLLQNSDAPCICEFSFRESDCSIMNEFINLAIPQYTSSPISRNFKQPEREKGSGK